MKKIVCVLTGILCAGTITAHAADVKEGVPAPKTKLEEFSARTGVVIIRGFQTLGKIDGLYSTSVEVDAKEFVNVSTNKRQHGITIKVVDKSGRYEKSNTSFIDYDEIDSLISGIDYIAKVNKSATNFSNFQADYSTKGSLKVSTFSSSGKILAAIKSGRSSSYFNMESLKEIRELIAKAKNTIDELK